MISAAVEGDVDEAVLRRISTSVGIELGRVYGKCGKSFLRNKVGAYNNAARFSPWILLVDLDHEHECAPELRDHWLPVRSAFMSFRIAVREVEAWILADREGLARMLHIPSAKVPTNPDSVTHPKETLIELARGSRNKAVREDIVPRPAGGRRVGPLYSSRLIEFVGKCDNGWNLDAARKFSSSCQKCIVDLESLAERFMRLQFQGR